MVNSHQIVKYNPKRRTTIYKMNHYKTKRPIYVGQTGNKARRASAYRSGVKRELEKGKQTNLALAHIRECQDEGVQVDLVPLPEFPDGVPADRADGFEALFINDLKTSSEHPNGCNTSMGNCLAEHKPRFPEYRAELAASGGKYVWSEADIAMRDAVVPEVVKAQAQLAALEDVQAMVREEGDFATPVLDDQVKNALVVVNDAMRMYMGPLQLAEALAAKYETQLSVLPVDADEFKKDLNALRDKLNDQPVPDPGLLGLCKAAEFMTKREVTAGFVAHQFRALADAIQAFDEAKLPKCDEVDMMKEVREELADTGKDWLKAGTSLYKRLATWKREVHKTTAPADSRVADMCFVLRSKRVWVEKFTAWLDYDKEAVMKKLTSALNGMILKGYAHPSEPDFEGKKKWPGGTNGTETQTIYQAMKDTAKSIAMGKYQGRIDALLEGLKEKWPARDAWWRDPTGVTLPKGYVAQKAEAEAEAAVAGA